MSAGLLSKTPVLLSNGPHGPGNWHGESRKDFASSFVTPPNVGELPLAASPTFLFFYFSFDVAGRRVGDDKNLLPFFGGIALAGARTLFPVNTGAKSYSCFARVHIPTVATSRGMESTLLTAPSVLAS